MTEVTYRGFRLRPSPLGWFATRRRAILGPYKTPDLLKAAVDSHREQNLAALAPGDTVWVTTPYRRFGEVIAVQGGHAWVCVEHYPRFGDFYHDLLPIDCLERRA